MKPLLKSIRAQKKIILIFLFAILFPLVTVVYLSIDTFFDRQQSTKRLLESNLWISSESALNQIENELVRLEDDILNSQFFKQFSFDTLSSSKRTNIIKELDKKYSIPFLLDEKFNIVHPRTGNDESKIFKDNINISNLKFDIEFQKAETFEFLQKKYTKAIKQYWKCFSIAKNNRNKAFVLEGIGRSQYSLKKYSLAVESYKLLYEEYPKILNKAGHPYGIISILQLYEINKFQGTNANLIPKLFDAYKKLKDGYWLINSSSYAFFISEIKSILESEIEKSPNVEYKKQYELLLNISSSYLQDLLFKNYLNTDVIRKIEEKLLIANNEKKQSKRFFFSTENKWSLVSLREFTNFVDNDTYIGGFKWEIDSLRKSIIPLILENISADTGLKYSLSREEDVGALTARIPGNSLTLSFRKFPLPWKLVIVQPALNNLEKETKKEMLIFGLLLTILIIFMFMGALLLIRDFKRESDSMRVKTDFIHNVSHELKTPLSLIRLYGETLLIKENLKEEEKKDAFHVITKESERLSHMINNILDFSKIEMGKREFKFEKGNFANVIRDTLNSYRYHLEKKGFKITEEIANDIPIIAFDKEAIEGLLVNILSNAIKYSSEKKILTIKLTKQNRDVLLQVSDKGIGIPADELTQIFDRFYRSKQKSGFEARGSGLGLTLVKHVVNSHGGKIKVESEPGEGSSFSIEFPI